MDVLDGFHTKKTPVDCLTKLRGNTSRMLNLMRTGRYQLCIEEEEMERRKEYREKTGKRNPRPMRTTETFYQDPRGEPPKIDGTPTATSSSTPFSLISLMTMVDFTRLPSTEQCKADLKSHEFKKE